MACSDVKICLAEGGSTQCIVLPDNANDCPPCMYAITGGGYSCYTRKNEKCPFAPIFAVCEKSSSTSTPPSESSNSNDSTKAPAVDPAPALETSTPETPTSTPETQTSETPTSETPSKESTSNTQIPETSDSTTNKDTTGSNATQSSEIPLTGTSVDPTPTTILSNTTAASSSSNMVASLALVGGAAVLVVIVILFVARRVAKKKEKTMKLDCTVSMRDSHRSAGTLSSGASSANMYSTYRYKIEDDNVNGISMLTDSQANSTYGPNYAGQTIHSGPSSRPMAAFPNYGEPHFSENSRFYSLNTGMGVNGQQHYAHNEMPTPLTQAGSHFVNVTSSLGSNRSIGLDSPRSGEHPLTVSQLMPTAAVGGYDEEAYETRQKAGSLVYGHVPPRAFDSAISQSNRQFGVSTASSMRSEYDIVDPVTMREVEIRNSEMLAQANCYPKFSFESEVDIYDGELSEEESSDDGHAVEHTV